MLSRKIYTLPLMLLLACFAFRLLAQENTYRFESIDSRKGLSHNQVNSIFKDERGFVWFGTMSGLNRYDGYNFKIFRYRKGDSTSLNDDYISKILPGPQHTMWVFANNSWSVFDPRTETFSNNIQRYVDIESGSGTFTNIVRDRENNFWFVYPGRGLYKYNSVNRKTVLLGAAGSGSALHSAAVNGAVCDGQGFIWIVYGDGVLEKLNPVTNTVVFRSDLLKKYTPAPVVNYRVFADKDNDLWIFQKGDEVGAYYFNPAKNLLRPLNKESAVGRLNNNMVNAILQDERGFVWLATDHGGINLINKSDFSIQYLLNNEADLRTISQNSVTTLYKDPDGIIWTGTFKKGANFFHETNLRFPLFQNQSGNAQSLPYNDVNKFVEDKKGNLWIGTNGGGLIYFNRTKGDFKLYVHSANDAFSLSNNIIVSLCLDREGKLWIGTYGGGMDCFDGKKFIHYRHNERDPESLADDRIWEILEDSQGRLWVGTLRAGLDLFDRRQNKFIHYKPGLSNNTLRSSYVSSITEDQHGNLWFGTAEGIDMLDKQSGTFRHFEHKEGDETTLSNNNIIEFLHDSRGLIWIATRNGLNIYDPVTQRFKIYRIEDGLPDNTVLTVMEDDNHNVWVTTPNGLCNITVLGKGHKDLSLRFKNFDESDGLQGRQFNENAALKLRNGELVVGGANGFNVFLPAKSGAVKAAPLLVLTDLQVFNNTVKIGEKYNGRIVLPQAISESKEITLQYNQNVFTIGFSALEFLSADRIKYAYKLEGFSNNWLITDANNRKATFTNLNPGTYTLLVKASNNEGAWSNKPLSLSIRILPPFWLTSYAFVAYALLVLMALFFGRRMVLRRERARFAITQVQQEAQRLHELDMMKIKFFTNVSHEFRTPLSLIISPVEKMLKNTGEPGQKKDVQLIHRNARRLLHLVNQLLDFRKLEEHELKLNKTSGDIIRFIKDVASSFSDIAENKKIAFVVQCSEDLIFTAFDHDKLERILFNLLSNAFKFTPAGGAVRVLVEVSAKPGEKMLQIKVVDTGIGIAKDKQEKIFDRFFQNEIPGTMLNQGSGIGLAITKEFVRLHGGTITVESQADIGSAFTVLFPLSPIEIESPEPVLPKEETGIEQPFYKPEGIPAAEKLSKSPKKTILLVEDNDDFRFYIKDNLKAYYYIIEATNGKAGWQKALAEHPDLIVCDISMPEMNGVELCQKLKDDNRTAFIPVILLTALTGAEQQLAGLQTGASDYMTKPFNFEILLSKIGNLLLQQENYRKTYQKQVYVQPSELPSQESADEKFMRRILEVIEKNMSNPDFTVEELSREILMDRAALYRKLFTLSGKPPLEFIRSFRLQRAAQLLLKKELTVTEVAYEVGFNNPKYFSKLFKQEYGVLPSNYKNADTPKA